MFRKIVSNLPFSPALVGQLSFYARRLRKEEATRKAGLIITALALVVQSLAVFNPPTAVNAASSADFIPGGVTSKQDLLKEYDKNTGKIKQVLSSLGITRSELAGTSKRTIGEQGYFNWSRTSLYSYAQGQRSWNYGGGNVFYRPMTLTAGADTTHEIFAGKSKTFGWFAIKIDCGNIVTDKPPRAPKPAVTCEQLTAERLSPIRYRLHVKATTENGAKINGYQFIIKGGGKTKYETKNVSKNSASYFFESETSGEYVAEAVVLSSLGRIKSNQCRDTLSIRTSAQCLSLNVAKLSTPGNFRLTGKSNHNQGVTVERYIYQIYNSNNKLIATKKFDSKNKLHSFIYKQQTPGTYTAKVTVKTSIGPFSGANCKTQFTIPTPPKPVAACVNIEADIMNRTLVTLNGEASASNGAKISSYTFVIKNSKGEEVNRQNVPSTTTTATSKSFTLAPGSYTAQVTVATSVGPQTNTDNCATPFDIEKAQTCPQNPALPVDSPDCQPCPDNPNVWIKDDECAADLINTKTATNSTQGNIDATTRKARAGDKITYTL